MIPLGLRRSELRAFEREMAGSHSFRVRVQVLNMEHEVLANLTDDILDGQVNIDADAEVTRSATITFLDRRGTYDFDSDSPSDGALYMNRMLRIFYDVPVHSIGERVRVPIFCGPVIKLDRAGDEVNVECQGKEILAMGAAVKPMTVKKGTKKVDAIQRIMRERGGEANRYMDLPELGVKLPKAVSLGRESQPWVVAQKIAQSMNRQLFYDGRGVLRLRRYGDNPLFTFADGSGGTVMSPPQVAFSTDEVANAVWVKGGKPRAKKDEDDPKKEKERGVRHFEAAPRNHPLSPWRLGRPDAPRFIMHTVENDKIRSEKEAREVAQRILKRKLQQNVEVTFDTLPMPHLEPEDQVRINADGVGLVLRVAQSSIPLKHDGVQTWGYLRRVSNRRRRRNRR